MRSFRCLFLRVAGRYSPLVLESDVTITLAFDVNIAHVPIFAPPGSFDHTKRPGAMPGPD